MSERTIPGFTGALKKLSLTCQRARRHSQSAHEESDWVRYNEMRNHKEKMIKKALTSQTQERFTYGWQYRQVKEGRTYPLGPSILARSSMDESIGHRTCDI